MTTDHVIYWIRYEDMTDPTTQGYVGVTNNIVRRSKHHLSTLKHNRHINTHLQHAYNKCPDIVVTTIYTGTAVECYNEEYRLRPTPNVGWNLIIGGTAPPNDLAASALRGKPLTEAHRQAIRDNHVGMRGRHHTERTKEQMSHSAKQRRATPEARAAISESKKGTKNPNYGIKKSNSTKMQIQASNQLVAALRKEFSKISGIPYKQVTKHNIEFMEYRKSRNL